MLSVLRSIFPCAICVVWALSITVAHGQVCNEASTYPGLNERPVPITELYPVEISTIVNNVVSVDDITRHWHADFYLTLRWIDPRINSTSCACHFACAKEKLWSPPIELINNIDVSRLLWRIEHDPIRHELFYRARYNGLLWIDGHSLRTFPFDIQDLPIIVEAFYDNNVTFWSKPLGSSSTGNAELDSVPSTRTDNAADSSLQFSQEWSLKGAAVHVNKRTGATGIQGFDRYRFDVRMQRNTTFYIFKLYIIIVIIVISQIVVFLIDRRDIKERITAAMAGFVALVTFSFVTSRNLPKVGYLTSIDLFILVSYLFLFATALESLLVWLIDLKKNPEQAEIRKTELDHLFTKSLDEVMKDPNLVELLTRDDELRSADAFIDSATATHSSSSVSASASGDTTSSSYDDDYDDDGGAKVESGWRHRHRDRVRGVDTVAESSGAVRIAARRLHELVEVRRKILRTGKIKYSRERDLSAIERRISAGTSEWWAHKKQFLIKMIPSTTDRWSFGAYLVLFTTAFLAFIFTPMSLR